MPKKMETRDYKMPDADLKQLADGLTNSIERDATDFATRNIAAAQLTAFQTLIDAFDSTTTDEELLGMVTVATGAKDAVAENLRKAIRPIRNMADLAYSGKGKYIAFGFDDMDGLSDADLYRLARRVVRVSNKTMADLQPQGLTAAQLTALNALATELDAKLDLIGEAIEDRDIETQDRIMKGNTLYTEMMRLASIGKVLYADSNEAKYNDYVLVGTNPAGPATEPVTPAV